MTKVACIGSRRLDKTELELCNKIGVYLAREGYIVSSGNSVGADQAYAFGANSVDPSCVHVYLPWSDYNKGALFSENKVFEIKDEWYKIASRFHPYWNTLKQGALKLHARNVGIVENSVMVIAFPGTGWLGGTGMGMRLAKYFKAELHNLRDPQKFEYWQSLTN